MSRARRHPRTLRIGAQRGRQRPLNGAETLSDEEVDAVLGIRPPPSRRTLSQVIRALLGLPPPTPPNGDITIYENGNVIGFTRVGRLDKAHVLALLHTLNRL